MLRYSKLGLVLTFLALLLPAPARADDQPFVSMGALVESGMITGTEATLGAYSGPIDATIDPITGAITNGLSTITFKDGSSLTFTFEGQISPDLSVAGVFTITGGTKALAGASGGGVFTGMTDGTIFVVDIEGTLTLP